METKYFVLSLLRIAHIHYVYKLMRQDTLSVCTPGDRRTVSKTVCSLRNKEDTSWVITQLTALIAGHQHAA